MVHKCWEWDQVSWYESKQQAEDNLPQCCSLNTIDVFFSVHSAPPYKPFFYIKLEFKNRKISLFLCKYRTGLFTWNTPEYNGKQRVYIKGTFAMIKITANCPCYDGLLFFASTPVYFTNHCNPQCPALFITKNSKQYWIQTKICNIHKKYALL